MKESKASGDAVPGTTPQQSSQATAPPQVDDRPVQEPEAPESPSILMTPEARSEVLASPAPQFSGSLSPELGQVHIAPNLLDLTTGRVETAAEKEEARQQHDLDGVIHNVLIVGLAISTILLLIGIGLEIIRRQDLPVVEPDLSQVFAQAVGLRASGFLALGLLVLIATPVMRVIGSIIAFVYERDWRFAGITLIVLMVLVLSTVLGKG